MLETLIKICRENPDVATNGQNVGHLTSKLEYVVSLPPTQKLSLHVKWYQAIRVAEEV